MQGVPARTTGLETNQNTGREDDAMKVVKYKEIEPVRMDNEVARGVAGRVLIGAKDGAERFCMRIFELSPGGHTPKHTHDWEHEIFVHAGKGEVFIDGRWHGVEGGTAVFVPPGTGHQVRNAGEDPLVFVCLIPAGPPEM